MFLAQKVLFPYNTVGYLQKYLTFNQRFLLLSKIYSHLHPKNWREDLSISLTGIPERDNGGGRKNIPAIGDAQCRKRPDSESRANLSINQSNWYLAMKLQITKGSNLKSHQKENYLLYNKELDGKLTSSYKMKARKPCNYIFKGLRSNTCQYSIVPQGIHLKHEGETKICRWKSFESFQPIYNYTHWTVVRKKKSYDHTTYGSHENATPWSPAARVMADCQPNASPWMTVCFHWGFATTPGWSQPMTGPSGHTRVRPFLWLLMSRKNCWAT